MKLKAILLALFVAGIGASAALAEKGPKPKDGTTTGTTTTEHRKGKHSTEACKPTVSLILKGTFVSAGMDSFVMTVSKSNKHARALEGKDVTVTVDAQTRFRRGGHAKLTDLQKGDRVMAQVRACKKASGASVALVARRVDAHPAKSKDGPGTTTGGTTTGGTTGGTTTGGTGTTTGGTTGGATTG